MTPTEGIPRGFKEIRFIFLKIFWCGPFLKSLLKLSQYCFCLGCFFFFFFGCEAHRILAPWPGIKLAPAALIDKVLTSGQPRKSLDFFKQCVSYIPRSLKSLKRRNTGFPKLKFKHTSWHHLQRIFPPSEGAKEADREEEESYLAGDARIALRTLAVLHLRGQGQVYDVRAGHVQRDRIQPSNTQTDGARYTT